MFELDFRDKLSSDPGSLGLKYVAEANASGGYDFDFVRVWADGEGRLWWAHTSGCSCPPEFHEFNSMADLHQVEDPRSISRPYGLGDARWTTFVAEVRRAKTITRPKFSPEEYAVEQAEKAEREQSFQEKQTIRRRLWQCVDELGLRGELDGVDEMVAVVMSLRHWKVAPTLILGVFLASAADSQIEHARALAEQAAPTA
jgi:hypothetical protein